VSYVQVISLGPLRHFGPPVPLLYAKLTNYHHVAPVSLCTGSYISDYHLCNMIMCSNSIGR